MKINFTKKQFQTLLELVYLGEWTVNASRVERLEEYDELAQYIYTFAKDFGYEDDFQYDSKYKEFFPNKSFEEKMQPLINENDTEVFWNELTSNLARRDMQSMANTFRTHDEYMKKFFEIEGEYEDEFVENGIKHLRLVKDS